jgi:hypothetical protein
MLQGCGRIARDILIGPWRPPPLTAVNAQATQARNITFHGVIIPFGLLPESCLVSDRLRRLSRVTKRTIATLLEMEVEADRDHVAIILELLVHDVLVSGLNFLQPNVAIRTIDRDMLIEEKL